MLVTINLEVAELRLVIQALQCTAAISDENGHDTQTQTIRDLYKKLEEIL